MMMNIYILLDRSGSMVSHWDETIGSINGYIEELGNVSGKVMVAVFDNIGYNVIRNSDINCWVTLYKEEVMPRGGTPLYDASVRMMHHILDDKPVKAVFLVLTDGFENQSSHFTQSDVKNLVKELDEKKYETIFLGANFDAVGSSAMAYGKGETKTANMTTGNMDTFMRTSVAAATTRYMSGSTATFEFTPNEKKVGEKKK